MYCELYPRFYKHIFLLADFKTLSTFVKSSLLGSNNQCPYFSANNFDLQRGKFCSSLPGGEKIIKVASFP